MKSNNKESWIYKVEKYSAEDTSLNGNRFILGNGFIGCRGTLDEHGKNELAAVMLNGVYDQVPGMWREPVNAPNALFTTIENAGGIISHEQSLNFRYGIMSRKTEYQNATVSSERFVSMDDIHLICLQYCSTVPAKTGIDCDVWNISGDHFKVIEADDRRAVVKTGELGIIIAVCAAVEETAAGAFNKYISIYTSLDCVDPSAAAEESCRRAAAAGYEKLRRNHEARWEEIWNRCDVKIAGDDEAQFALRYSLYQLQLAASRHSDRLSIPARGLSGQVYKGAIFWDTEMFMTPVFSLTDPAVARNLILYRFHTLDGARRKAAELGFRGAYFAWESQETGDDACSYFNVTDVFTGRPMRTYFRDKQIHVSADMVYAIDRYVKQTGDNSIYNDGAAELMAECARFFFSYAYYKNEKSRYELLDVVGPDEYHERVNNNAFTNRMAKRTLETTLDMLAALKENSPAFYDALDRKINFTGELNDWRDMAEKLYIPAPDENGIIPQFDGYEKLEDATLADVKARMLEPTEYLGGGNGPAVATKVLKQADVILMLYLFRNEYAREIKQANWEYYEPRTEHGSSLSACMYAMVAAEIGKPDWAYDYFMKTATVDLTGKSKQYIGPQYIGGTHPAANGGAWMSAVFGFAGLRADENGITLNPSLPSHWKNMEFPIEWRGQRYRIFVSPEKSEVIPEKI